MASCKIDYIQKAPLSRTEKDRLETIHRNIFTKAKESKAFRSFNDKLYTLKNDYAKGTAFVKKMNDDYSMNVTRIEKDQGGSFLTVNVLPLSTEKQEVLFQDDFFEQSKASEETLNKVKEVLAKMKVEIVDLQDYAKANDLDTTTVNGVADLAKGIIALASGREDVALTEEMVHIATAIVEQRNPKLVTEMISKIDRFKIYKETLQSYKDYKYYQLPNGKPDIRKIKKEAVDKLIAEIIVNNNENIEQYPELREEENQSLIRKWWNSILDWILEQYKDTNIQIFEEVAEQIMSGDVGTFTEIEGVYFQLTSNQQEVLNKLKATKESIKKVVTEEKQDPLLLDSEEANNYYELTNADGTTTRIKKRVTDKVKAWYKKKFGTKTFTPQEKAFNELKREFGIQGHLDFEEIHARYYTPEGTKRDKPLDRPEKFNLPKQDMYDKLEKYYTDLVNSFPKDTIILSEQIIYDPKEKEAGTIDFLAIEPSGKAHILDWKFMNITGEDVAWFKQGAFNIQLGTYKNILRNYYGIKDFGMTRAIPIAMEFKPESKQKDAQMVLKGIAIGSVDVSKIEDIKLIPISEETESTGYEALDEVLVKLNAILKQISSEKATSDEEQELKRERENALRKAIRQAHSTLNISPLIDVIEVMRKEGDKILSDYNTIYKDKPARSEDVNDKVLSDFADEMNDYLKVSEEFVNIDRKLGALIYTPDMLKNAKNKTEEENAIARKEVLDNLKDQANGIYESREAIRRASLAFADKHIGERNLVAGLTKPEKVVKGLGSLFRGVAELPMRALEVLSKLTRAAQTKAAEDAFKSVEKLMDIRKKLIDKGGDIKELVTQLYQKTDSGIANRLIYKYSEEFRKTVEEKAQKGGDIDWLKENIDIEAYKAEANKVLKRQIEYINKTSYPGTKEEEESRKDKEILKAKKQWDIDHEDFNGWDNYIIKRHPLPKWYSEEYKKVLANPELLELYNFIVEFNEKAKDIGYISNQISKNFLPFIRKSMAEQLVWDGSISPIDNFKKSLELNPEDTGYGKINEITGELENSIPKYYTYDFTKKEDGVHDYSEVSQDLFKNMILYIQQVEKYKYMSEIEGQLNLVKTIEQFKGHLNTDKSSKVIFKDGKPDVRPGNEENSKMFDDFLRVLLYEQKYVLSDADTPLNMGGVIDFAKKSVNQLVGKEVLKPNEGNTATSLIKTIDAANRAFQMKTLGFEFISGAVNMFGGNIQLATQAGNYFKAREFAKNEAKLTLQKFENEEEKEVFVQLINTFMPLKDDPSYELYKNAGMSALTRGSLSDTLFVFMRKPEQLIEKSVFLTLLQNTMVENGKIVNIREFVKRKYSDRYTSAAKYNESKAKIEQEIEELKKTRAISVTRKLEDGKLVIPGLDLTNREELQRLTNLSRNIASGATGNLTKDNVNRMSMSVWTKSMMVFKNWIPKLADTRFSEFRKVSDDFSVRINEEGIAEGQKYDIGRLRLLGYVLSAGLVQGVKNLNNIMYLNDSGLTTLDEMFEDFRQKYETETGETLNMTREEFIDLIRTNLRNQLKELAILGGLLGVMLSLGFIAPEDDDDKAAKNAHRYALRVVDKFVSELSFFYNPAELESILSGGIFPAVGIANDFSRFTSNFFKEITGIDMDPDTSFEDVRKKAQPIKYAMKMAPVTKSLVTYLAIFSEDFAKEMDVTIQKENR